MLLRPGRAFPMPIVTQEELAQLVPRHPLGTLGVVPGTLQVADRFHGLVRNIHLRQIAGAKEVRELRASRRSVFTRSPGLPGTSEGATTMQSIPAFRRRRHRPNPVGPAS